MTLYETIFVRRQVRKYDPLLERQIPEEILKYVLETRQFAGQQAKFTLASAEDVSGGPAAPYYLLSYCDANSAAYANVGYVIQKANLYLQSIGLGGGWFNGPKPKSDSENFCIAFAFGGTDVPVRKGPEEFKRLPMGEISRSDNSVVMAVRLAPSALNSQPWYLTFEEGKVVIKYLGRGLMRMMLRNKLNKIDLGIAARHAVLALEQEGKKVTGIMPRETGKEFAIEICYSK